MSLSDTQRNMVLGLVLIAIFIAIGTLEAQKVRPHRGERIDAQVETPSRPSAEQKAQVYPVAREIVNPSGFVNSEGVTIQELIGKKVILVDFWTYSCINCQRTLPYITSWYEKYKDQGLEIVGIHTPEFKFEEEYDNVVDATERFGIDYPVVLDNDYGTWTAYNNRYWPRKYIIDIDGFVVYDHIGEGAYEETERVIQQLLLERQERLDDGATISSEITTPDNAERVDHSRNRTHETYIGAKRNGTLANGQRGVVGVQDFAVPDQLETSVLYLDGQWHIDPEFARNQEGGARIIMKYQAEKVFLVARSNEGVRARILIDGEPVGDRAGVHVDEDGTVLIQGDQLYRLVEDPAGWGEHVLEIIIEEPGVEAFAFTFG